MPTFRALRTGILILCAIQLPLFLIAQKSAGGVDIENLLYKYQNETDDSIKVIVGQQLIEGLFTRDKNKAEKINSEIFGIAKTSENPIIQAKAYYFNALFDPSESLAFEQHRNLHLDTASLFLEENKNNIEEYELKKLRLNILNNRGVSRYNSGAFEEAVEFYQKALRIAEEINDIPRIASINYNIAIIHYVLDNYEEALPRLKATYEFAKKNQQANIEAGCLTILGSTYQLVDSLELAKNYIRKSITLARRNGTTRMYQEALMGMSLVMEDLGEIDSAFYYLQLSMENSKAELDPLVEAQQYLNLARLENKRGNRKEARQWFRKSKSINEKLVREEIDLQYLIDIAELEYMEGNYKLAFEYMRDGHYRQDSFNSKENKSLIKELELKYGKEQDEKMLALQELKLEKKQRKISNLTTGIIFSILGLIIFYGFFRNARDKEERAKDELAIKNLKLETLEKQNSILSLTASLEGQEAERSRIAHDLHDGLGSTLSSVKAHFSFLEDEIKSTESIKMYEKAQSLMDNACEEVRRISHNLMPPLLRTQGLAVAIENLVSNMQSTSHASYTLDIRNMEERLSGTQEIFIYRICQELLSNIEKHAEAEEVEISLYGLGENIQIIVEDDGIGFDVTSELGGMGLSSIRSRVQYLGGEVDIDSKEESGTTISINIPKADSGD